MSAAHRHAAVELMHATPRYELRVARRGAGDLLLEVFQLPSLATPEVKETKYVGGLGGRNLALVEHRPHDLAGEPEAVEPVALIVLDPGRQ